MKKLFLISISIALLSVTSNAQIKVNSTGKVGIGVAPSGTIDLYTPEAKITNLGVNTTPSSTYPLYSDGRIKFSLDIATPLLMDCYLGPYELSLYPSSNNQNYIGRSTAAFNQMWAYDFTDVSDARQKENIVNISDALEIVLKLQGVKYDIKKEYSYDASQITDQKVIDALEEDRKNKIGFLAQDVYTILPEVVTYVESEDAYGISYSKVIPVLVEAIKEQESRIKEIEEIFNIQPNFKGATTDLTSISTSTAVLEQNSPNPFTEKTYIKYSISELQSNAMVNIYDLQGRQIKTHGIYSVGTGEIIIHNSELYPGIFIYNLIVDGVEIDSKRMVLTD